MKCEIYYELQNAMLFWKSCFVINMLWIKPNLIHMPINFYNFFYIYKNERWLDINIEFAFRVLSLDEIFDFKCKRKIKIFRLLTNKQLFSYIFLLIRQFTYIT